LDLILDSNYDKYIASWSTITIKKTIAAIKEDKDNNIGICEMMQMFVLLA